MVKIVLYQLQRVDDWEFRHQLALILAMHIGIALLLYFGFKFYHGG